MTPLDPNIVIPAVTGIVGAFVGAVSSFVPNMINDYFKNKRESKIIEAALISEIQALVEIAEARKYVKGLEQVCAYLASQPTETTYPFTVGIPDHYSRIYQVNAHRLGSVSRRTAVDIIRFHQFADAVVQDVRPGGTFSEGGT
ncbi:MAG: hypothetical protein ACRD5H_11785, partial [Nitrososphaerales archaeon]